MAPQVCQDPATHMSAVFLAPAQTPSWSSQSGRMRSAGSSVDPSQSLSIVSQSSPTAGAPWVQLAAAVVSEPPTQVDQPVASQAPTPHVAEVGT